MGDLKMSGRTTLSLLFLLAAAIPAQAAEFPRSAPPGQCRVVHGRMALYNGTFSFRIWVVGTHRMLRVVDAEGDNFNAFDQLPDALASSLEPYRNDPFRPRVFADFQVCAFTVQKPGVMQSVALEGARNIRVEERVSPQAPHSAP